MGDHLFIMPKIKGVRAIETDQTRKCILLKKSKETEAIIESFAKEKGYEITPETVALGYDNLSMSMCLPNNF